MKIEIICEQCGSSFLREKGEVTRNAAIGRKMYCSRQCSGKMLIKNIPVEKSNRVPPIRTADEYSAFRVFMARAKQRRRDRGRSIDISLSDLKAQWDLQKGICPYTGWTMQTPKSTSSSKTAIPNSASLDRIDSSKGYVVGNIQFISLMAQYAKNKWTPDTVVQFGKAVADYHA